MHAGEAHGITEESDFTLFSGSADSVSGRSLCTVTPSEIGVFVTELDVPESKAADRFTTGLAYQVRSGSEEALHVYVSPDKRLDELRNHLSGEKAPLPGFTVVRVILCTDIQRAHLLVTLQGNKVAFELSLLPPTSPSSTLRVARTTTFDLAAITRVLHYTARYMWHLRRHTSNNALGDRVSISFTELVESEDEYDDDLCPALKPVGDNLVFNGCVHIQCDSDSENLYGLKIANHTHIPLYVSVFLFDSDLSILTYYESSAAPVGKQADAPLPAARKTGEPGVLTIGYGASGVGPFQYALADNLDADLSFLKVFLSTKYMDLSFVAQDSPFESPEAEPTEESPESANEAHSRGVAFSSAKVRESPHLWDTVVIPIVQTQSRPNTP